MGKVFKVFVCGAKSVGKTSLLEIMIYGEQRLSKIPIPTFEDSFTAQVQTDRGNVETVIFHELGEMSETNFDISRQYIYAADAYLLLYDITSVESSKIVERILEKINEKTRSAKKELPPILLVGTKLDLEDRRTLLFSKMSRWASQMKLRHCETSIFNPSLIVDSVSSLISRMSSLQGRGAMNFVRKNKADSALKDQ